MKALTRIGLSALAVPVVLFSAFGLVASFEPPGSWGAAYIYAMAASAGALLITGPCLAPRGRLQN